MPTRNRILRLVSNDTLEVLTEGSSTVNLPSGRTLWQQDAAIRKVYFPLTAVISLLVKAGDSREVEVATIGNEGIVSPEAGVSVPRAVGRAMVQVPGAALAIPVQALLDLTHADAQFANLMQRYFYYLMRSAVQTAACHRFHNLEERCARWLLLMHDRAGDDEFELTQKFLAEMMGVGRPKVTQALASLRRHHAVDYSYRRIVVRDREQLESLACPCYEDLRRVREAIKI